MPIEIKTVFYVECDRCLAVLRPKAYDENGMPERITTFDEPLHAIHRAIEQGWTARANAIYCPTCSLELDVHRKDA